MQNDASDLKRLQQSEILLLDSAAIWWQCPFCGFHLSGHYLRHIQSDEICSRCESVTLTQFLPIAR